MKKIIAILAIAAFLPTANAGDSDFTSDAEFRLRYTNEDNADYNAGPSDTQSMFEQRLKLNGNYRAGEKFSLHYTLLHNARWGADSSSILSSNNGTFDSFSANNTVLVNQAYATWMSSDDLSFRAGRFGLELADGSVLSVDDYQNTPFSFEGLGMFYNTSFAHVAAFAANLAQLAGGTTSDPEMNAYILSTDFKSLPDFLKMANLHIVQLTANETAAPSVNQLNFGLTLGGDTAGFDYVFTYASQGGETAVGTTATSISASMMNLGLGYTMGNIKFVAGYHTDTGDDAATTTTNEGYDPFYYDDHKYSGLGDFTVARWGNLTSVNAGLDWTGDDLSAGFHYYTFAETQLVGTDSSKGSEMDITIDKKYSDNFKIGAFIALFTPSEETAGGTGSTTDADQKFVVNTTWNF